MYIKVGDTVVVNCGDDRKQQGRVLEIDGEAGTVVVEGINRVWKHVRRSQKNPQGGRLSKEMPVQLANVSLLCGRCNRGVRTGARRDARGAKERFCRKCGQSLGAIAPAKS